MDTGGRSLHRPPSASAVAAAAAGAAGAVAAAVSIVTGRAAAATFAVAGMPPAAAAAATPHCIEVLQPLRGFGLAATAFTVSKSGSSPAVPPGAAALAPLGGCVVAVAATALVAGRRTARQPCPLQRRRTMVSAGPTVVEAPTQTAAAGAAADEAAAWARFAAWLTARGGDVSAVTFGRPNGMRGLVATRNIKEGESIIEVPLGAAVEVADDASQRDPSLAALTLLRLYREESSENAPYFDLIPGMGSAEMATMPDFFSEEELAILQHPCAEKAQRRQQLCRDRATEHGLKVEDVTWALCTVAQRSFTVLSPIDGVLRLLLPGIDMLNHDADSLHNFKVRWNLHGVFEGTFKVVAGSSVKKGEEVRICYGGSPHRPDGCDGDCKGDVAWTNDQYLQRYGFVDTSIGSTMVDGKFLNSDRGAPVREALAQTSPEEDEVLLKDSSLSVGARTAVSFRLHLKRALAAQKLAQKHLDQTGDGDLGELKEAKPHILPEGVKEQLRRAGVAYNGGAEASSEGRGGGTDGLRDLLLSSQQ